MGVVPVMSCRSSMPCPIVVPIVLAGSSATDLKALAKEADAIMEAGSMGCSATGISAVRKTTPKELCFYHVKFGKEARKCNQRGCKMGHLVLPTERTATQELTQELR